MEPANTSQVDNKQRLEALARRFGANTHPQSSDWSKPLLKLAVEVYHEFTRPGGKNSYHQHGSDVISPEELVNWVFMRWAEREDVTVEWILSMNEPGALLRMYLQNAARDLLYKNVEGNRSKVGVKVTPTGFTGSGLTEEGNEDGEAPDAFDWLANSQAYSSDQGVPEAEVEYDDLYLALEGVVKDIIERIENDNYRALAYLHYVEGMDVAEAADAFGVTNEYGKKAIQRARKSLSDDEVNALLRWRRAESYEGGKQVPLPDDLPKAFLQVLEERGIHL